jgi:hypothetical protein
VDLTGDDDDDETVLHAAVSAVLVTVLESDDIVLIRKPKGDHLIAETFIITNANPTTAGDLRAAVGASSAAAAPSSSAAAAAAPFKRKREDAMLSTFLSQQTGPLLAGLKKVADMAPRLRGASLRAARLLAASMRAVPDGVYGEI